MYIEEYINYFTFNPSEVGFSTGIHFKKSFILFKKFLG